jgi:hypothetical protein
VKALAREDSHRGVEDHPALVGSGGSCHQAVTE